MRNPILLPSTRQRALGLAGFVGASDNGVVVLGAILVGVVVFGACVVGVFVIGAGVVGVFVVGAGVEAVVGFGAAVGEDGSSVVGLGVMVELQVKQQFCV